MIIMLGMAGAGKSTQCRKISERLGLQWFSVGQYLRSIETGPQRAEMMMGKVLDDSIVTPLVRDELARLTDTPEVLLDGCPRTVEQATWLASEVDTPEIRIVVHLVIDDESAMARLMKRGREDDSQAAMRVRFEGYHRDILPVLREFGKRNIRVVEIDARASEEQVYADIEKQLKEAA